MPITLNPLVPSRGLLTVQNHFFRSAETMTRATVLFVPFGIIIALLLLSFTSTVLAVSVPRVTLHDTIVGTEVRETLTVTLDQNVAKNITLSLPRGAHTLQLDGKKLPDAENITVPLSCTQCRFELAYTLPDVIRQEGVTSVFSRTVNFPQRPGTFHYEVVLPAGSVVANDPVAPAIVPQHTEITTDGSRISIVWDSANPSLPQQYVITYTAGSDSEMTIGSELLEWPVWIIIGVTLGLGFAIGMGIQRHLHERFTPQDLPFVPKSLLSPDERTIVQLLTDEKGPVGQKEIGRRLGWSKSKVSAIMTNLEHKRIVSREKAGRNYTVTLEKTMGD
jgi:uncharacterized membrane protein